MVQGAKTLYILHGNVRPSLEVSGVVNAQNIRVIERSNDLGLIQKHFLRHFAAKLDFARRVYLDRHLTIDDGIVTPVDSSHATTPGNAEDRVLT